MKILGSINLGGIIDAAETVASARLNEEPPDGEGPGEPAEPPKEPAPTDGGVKA